MTGDDRWRQRRDDLFGSLLPSAAENVFGHLSVLNALDLYLTGAEIIITGGDDLAQNLLATARHLPHATTTISHVVTADRLASDHPVRDKIASVQGKAAAFVCRRQSCSLPVTDPAALTDLVLSHAT